MALPNGSVWKVSPPPRQPAGYAAVTLEPADGETIVARGQVVRPGRTLVVTQAEVFACKAGKETLCALMQQTIMVMHGKSEK
jgi:hypothetical protein